MSADRRRQASFLSDWRFHFRVLPEESSRHGQGFQHATAPAPQYLGCVIEQSVELFRKRTDLFREGTRQPFGSAFANIDERLAHTLKR